MTTLYSGGLRPFPGFGPAWSAEQTELAQRILDTVTAATYEQHEVRIIPDRHGDIEDFWEDACRLAAAWDASSTMELVADKTHWSDAELASRLGPVTKAEEGGHHARDRELMHPVFLRHAGPNRGLALLTIDSEGQAPNDLYAWMVAQAEAGVDEVVLKNAERKGGVWAVRTSTDLDACRRAVLEELGWTAIRLDGSPDSILGQVKRDLIYEYRCFVVDGVVISAAGCIEEFTPIDAIPGQPFDTRLRKYRGHLDGDPSTVLEASDVAAYLLEFAGLVAQEHGGTVVIDVALDAGDQTPVVVEFNALPNAGLYASDPWLVAAAVVQANDRGY